MKQSGMIIFALVFLPMTLGARDATQVSDYNNSGFKRVPKKVVPPTKPEPKKSTKPPVPRPAPSENRQPEESELVVDEEGDSGGLNSETTNSGSSPWISTRPQPRPLYPDSTSTGSPFFVVEEADPEIRFEDEPDYMAYGSTSDILARDRNTPVFQPFDEAFRRCAAPMGCTGASLYSCRGNSCRNESGSCHNSGKALDMNAIVCNGQRYGPFSAQFSRFVQCIKRVRIGSGPYGERTWATMFRETAADDAIDCATINAGNARSHPNRTICHWDHVHISMYCGNGTRY